MIDLSVIIVNWNTRDLLGRCLESVYHAAGPLKIEVLVVDNGSADGSAAMVRQRFAQTQLIANAENVGFARANNQALAKSRGRYLMLLNSDTLVLGDALQLLVAYMHLHPTVGAAGPRLLNADGSLQASCHPLLTPGREFWRLMFLERVVRRATYAVERWDPVLPREVEVIKGACMVVRRAVLDQVGLLDDRYFMYSEEMDLCYRISQAGWALYWVPQAQVVHYGGVSTRQMADAMYIELYRSKIQFWKKFGGARRARWFKVLIAVAYIPRWALFSIARIFDRTQTERARIYGALLARLHSM